MAPNIVNGEVNLTKEDTNTSILEAAKITEQATIVKPEEVKQIEETKGTWFLLDKNIIWKNVIFIFLFHAIAAYGFLTLPYIQRWKTFLWATFIGVIAAFGITGGIHRFWTHKAYKANMPLRVILMICYVAAGQNSIYNWVRDHRVHHKFSETDADPHNSKRGFFFSHVGWLMLRKHPEVLRKGKQIDMSDIRMDPVAAFCERHFLLLKLMICFFIPITVPVYFWNEDWYHATLFQICRYMYVLNATWSVNSFAHFFGNKPYNKNIAPVENKFVSYVAFGEGWHNYHHVFPSDYRAAEIGGGRTNITTSIINMFAKIGWAYDLKSAPNSVVNSTITNRGDGTHENLKNVQSVPEEIKEHSS